jgi:hypothetical protein
MGEVDLDVWEGLCVPEGLSAKGMFSVIWNMYMGSRSEEALVCKLGEAYAWVEAYICHCETSQAVDAGQVSGQEAMARAKVPDWDVASGGVGCIPAK